MNNLKFNELLSNSANYLTASRKKENIKYIVVHYVGATGSASQNASYFHRTAVGAGAHLFVDFNGEYWRSVKDKDIAYHCGGYVYPGTSHTYLNKATNNNSIGIEMCVRKDSKGNWYFEQETIDATIELVLYYMDKYDIDVDHVCRHHDVTGKDCPNPFVKDKAAWKNFKSELKRKRYATESGTYMYKNAYTGNYFVKIRKGDKVRFVKDLGNGMSRVKYGIYTGYVYNSNLKQDTLSKKKKKYTKSVVTQYTTSTNTTKKTISVNKKTSICKIPINAEVTYASTNGEYARVKYNGKWGWVLNSELTNAKNSEVYVTKKTRLYANAYTGKYIKWVKANVAVSKFVKDLGNGMSKVIIGSNTGYIYNSNLSNSKKLSTPKYGVTKSSINMFGTITDTKNKTLMVNSSNPIMKIPANTQVKVYCKVGKFYRIKYNKKNGWGKVSKINLK